MFSAVCLVFFFKQKTAYEMRISDWSSDVCSSDLPSFLPPQRSIRMPFARRAAAACAMKEGSETKHDDDARTLPLRRGHLRVRRCGALARLLPLRELPTQYLLAGHRLLTRVAQRLLLHRQDASRICLSAREPATHLRPLRQPDGPRDRPAA